MSQGCYNHGFVDIPPDISSLNLSLHSSIDGSAVGLSSLPENDSGVFSSSSIESSDQPPVYNTTNDMLSYMCQARRHSSGDVYKQRVNTTITCGDKCSPSVLGKRQSRRSSSGDAPGMNCFKGLNRRTSMPINEDGNILSAEDLMWTNKPMDVSLLSINSSKEDLSTVSPIMRLYMNSSNPDLKNYVETVCKLTGAVTPFDVGNTCMRHTSGRSSLTSLPRYPSSCNPCQTVIHMEEEPDEVLEVQCDGSSGSHIKPNIEKDVKKIQRQIITDVVYSCIRNFLCYLAVVALILTCIEGISFNDLPLWEKVVPLLLLCIGLIGIPLQIIHTINEFRCQSKSSVIAQMLKNWNETFAEFEDIITARRSAVPYIAVELRIKHRVKVKQHSDKDSEEGSTIHWTRVSKRMAKMLKYNGWCDKSQDLSNINFKHGSPNWVIVTKDYMTANKATDVSMRKDITDFCQESDIHFDEMCMKSQMILDVVEGEAYPDAQAFLIRTSDGGSPFYSFSVYKVMLVLGLDALYSIAFHTSTKFAGRYSIVKVVER